MEDDYRVLGIDLGGTYMRFGVVNSNGELSNWHHEPVNRSFSGDQFVEWVAQRAEAANCLASVQAVAIGIAGMVLHGQVLKPDLVVLPGLWNYPLSQKLSDRLHKPCWVGNDANLALRGETHFGAAKNFRNVLLLTLGTGIGGGLLLDGRLREGSHGSSVEIGPMLMGYPTDFNSSSIESLYSPGAVMKRLGDHDGLLYKRVRQGDLFANQLVNEMYQSLGMLITNIHLLLDLELVLISGGLAAAGEELVAGIRRGFQNTCPPIYQFDLKIELGALPVDTAGVIGAACLWFEQESLISTL